jgi:hypothetical protein
MISQAGVTKKLMGTGKGESIGDLAKTGLGLAAMQKAARLLQRAAQQE